MRLQLFQNLRSGRQLLAHIVGQLVQRTQQLFLIGDVGLECRCLRSCFRSSDGRVDANLVAEFFRYWPKTTVSALVKSAMRFSVDRSSCDCGETRRSLQHLLQTVRRKPTADELTVRYRSSRFPRCWRPSSSGWDLPSRYRTEESPARLPDPAPPALRSPDVRRVTNSDDRCRCASTNAATTAPQSTSRETASREQPAAAIECALNCNGPAARLLALPDLQLVHQFLTRRQTGLRDRVPDTC